MSQIAHNQYKTNLNINETFREINMTNYRLLDFINSSLLNLLKLNSQMILETLSTLENSISFSKLQITDPNLINPGNIHFIFRTLITLYSPNELLITVHTDIRDYYNLIKSRSYNAENMVVFILRFRIIYKNMYSYYHLYPLTTANNSIIILPKPYLAMEKDLYQYMEDDCKKCKDIYRCKETSLLSVQDHEDCIHYLIVSQEISASCIYTSFTKNRPIWGKMDDKHYVINFPHCTNIRTLCNGDSHNRLKGTYRIEILDGCNFSAIIFLEI